MAASVAWATCVALNTALAMRVLRCAAATWGTAAFLQGTAAVMTDFLPASLRQQHSCTVRCCVHSPVEYYRATTSCRRCHTCEPVH